MVFDRPSSKYGHDQLFAKHKCSEDPDIHCRPSGQRHNIIEVSIRPWSWPLTTSYVHNYNMIMRSPCCLLMPYSMHWLQCGQMPNRFFRALPRTSARVIISILLLDICHSVESNVLPAIYWKLTVATIVKKIGQIYFMLLLSFILLAYMLS